MKKIALYFLILFSTGVFAQNQQVNFGNNTPKNRSEWYRPNTPTNTVGNREVVGWIKSWDVFHMEMDTIRFTELKSSVNHGLPTGILWTDSDGNLKHSPSTEIRIPYAQITSTPNIPINTNQLVNGANFISTETDPNTPAYAKTLNSFSVIKSSTDLIYEPVFSKNTAFNKSFGVSSNTIMEGNDSRANNGQIAYGWGNHSTAGYLLSSTAAITYQPLGSYLSTETDPLFDTKFSGKTTTGLTEGSNLYYTSARFNSSFSAKTTSDLSEGSNQYYTNSRARSSISAGNELNYNSATGVISKTKRQESNSGTTNSSGVYTFTFANTYSVAPNVQANVINASDSQIIKIGVPTTTSVTVTVRNRVDVIGLLPTWINVNGANVDILVTEK